MPMSSGIDLSNVAVILSVKVDTQDRLANVERLASFYAHYGQGVEIIVVEQGGSAQINPDIGRGLDPIFVYDTGCHWKTRNMNLGARLSARNILLMSDCDTIPHPDALAEGLARITNGSKFVNLYNGLVINISKRFAASAESWDDFFNRARISDPIDIEPDAAFGDADQEPLYGNARYRAVGGCFLVLRREFFRAGGWNENFVSYGFEDMELDTRLRKLGIEASRTERHSLIHFAHERGWDSRYSTFYRLNQQEFERVSAMNADDLQHYANRGFKDMIFDHDHEYVRESGTSVETWRKFKSDRLDLFNLVVVVVADAQLVGYDASCLGPFADYLEEHFWNYDLRVNEIAGTHYKHIQTKRNLDYRIWRDGYDKATLDAVLAEAGRTFYYELRLGRDAKEQYARATSVFDRLRSGVPPEVLFGRYDPGLPI